MRYLDLSPDRCTSCSVWQIRMTCELCPRLCGADRRGGECGVCGADGSLRVARAALHHWEEPPISGTRGSGTVFFSNCSLRCSYCQNFALSRGKVGKAISIERLAEIFLELQVQGAHNINLVTPTHYVEEIIAALKFAGRSSGSDVCAEKSSEGVDLRSEGVDRHTRFARNDETTSAPHALHTKTKPADITCQNRPSSPLSIPIVYNTSGYERPSTIARLDGHVDIYLADHKYASATLADRYSQAADYPAVALKALAAMVEQVGVYEQDAQGILQRGVIVRHLLLPGQLRDSKEVLRRVFATVGNKVCYSLMSQFTPLPNTPGLPAELHCGIDADDYDVLVDFALELGITNSFMQEGGATDGTVEESFIPAFDLQGV